MFHHCHAGHSDFSKTQICCSVSCLRPFTAPLHLNQVWHPRPFDFDCFSCIVFNTLPSHLTCTHSEIYSQQLEPSSGSFSLHTGCFSLNILATPTLPAPCFALHI